MKDVLVYLFWPRPGATTYDNPKVVFLLFLCAGLIVASFVVRRWRRRLQNPVTKRLSRSWSSALFWFGLTSLFLIVARAEDVSFLSMRFLWVVWSLGAALFLFFQVKQFRMRHYEKLPTEIQEGPLEQYLPRRKRR